MPNSLDAIKTFFRVYNVHPALNNALDLIYKSEFEAAARESFVTLETVLRENLDSILTDLI